MLRQTYIKILIDRMKVHIWTTKEGGSRDIFGPYRWVQQTTLRRQQPSTEKWLLSVDGCFELGYLYIADV